MIMLSLFVLALALAMDAFAVALAQGAAGQGGMRNALRIGTAFGLAQGVMPLLGWGLVAVLGLGFADLLRAVDHWAALILLSFLGVRMAMQGLAQDHAASGEMDLPRLTNRALFAAAIATSIDAAIAGVTLPALGAPIVLACAVIGAVTAVLSFAGVLIGRMIGRMIGTRIGPAAEVAGGILLIGLGVKIFVEHQFLGG